MQWILCVYLGPNPGSQYDINFSPRQTPSAKFVVQNRLQVPHTGSTADVVGLAQREGIENKLKTMT